MLTMQTKEIDASEYIQAAKKKAFAAGYTAAETNKRRSPVLCKTYQALVAGLTITLGESLDILYNGWLEGYQTQLDELTAEIMAIPVSPKPSNDQEF